MRSFRSKRAKSILTKLIAEHHGKSKNAEEEKSSIKDKLVNKKTTDKEKQSKSVKKKTGTTKTKNKSKNKSKSKNTSKNKTKKNSKNKNKSTVTIGSLNNDESGSDSEYVEDIDVQSELDESESEAIDPNKITLASKRHGSMVQMQAELDSLKGSLTIINNLKQQQEEQMKQQHELQMQLQQQKHEMEIAQMKQAHSEQIQQGTKRTYNKMNDQLTENDDINVSTTGELSENHNKMPPRKKTKKNKKSKKKLKKLSKKNSKKPKPITKIKTVVKKKVTFADAWTMTSVEREAMSGTIFLV